MRRYKKATMPSAPKKFEDIDAAFQNEAVNNVYGRTQQTSDTEKNQFYRTTFVSEDFSYSLFASQRIIDLIQEYPIEKRRYMMDATFKIVPKMYSQLLVIYFETPTKHVCVFFI